LIRIGTSYSVAPVGSVGPALLTFTVSTNQTRFPIRWLVFAGPADPDKAQRTALRNIMIVAARVCGMAVR